MHKTYSAQEISEYYRLTEVHYRRGWKLDQARALHYGYWDEKVPNFTASLLRMNEVMASFAGIKRGMKVLDAGCGIGGSALFLGKKHQASVVGISLNPQQIEKANALAKAENLDQNCQFEVASFYKMPYEDESFDVVWGLESIIHAEDRLRFFKEAYRVLKPSGKLIVGDYYCLNNPSASEYELLMKWLNPWAVASIVSVADFHELMGKAGFIDPTAKDITQHILPSAKRMYRGSFYLRFLTWMYQLYNPKVSDFSKNHYKAMIYQWKALKRGLWTYQIITGKKVGV